MILKFNDYINESKLFFSENFASILTGMKSKIAEIILSKRKVDIEKLNVNYIDLLTDKNDEVSFTQDSRILRDLKAKNLHLKKISGDWISSVNEDNLDYSDLFESFGLKKDENLSFCMSGVIVELVSTQVAKADNKEYALCKDIQDDDFYIVGIDTIEKIDNIESKIGFIQKYYTLYRNRMKIGRLVRSLLKDIGVNFPDKDIEEFVNEYKAKIDKINNIEQFFEIVGGEDIRHWYHLDNYYEQDGSLGGSCMRYDECQDYLDIYVDNKNVQLLILKSPDNEEFIVGRALLWTLTDGSIFMDRVYVSKDFYSKVFREYATKNNWSFKKFDNSSEDCLIVSPDGSESEKELEVSVDGEHKDAYPYADTLKFYYIYDRKLSNVANKEKDYIKIEDTEGNLDREDFGCTECHGDNDKDCRSCHGEGYVSEECPSCDGNGNINDDCSSCDGKGKVDCDDCEGSGLMDCPDCDGSGNDGDDNCSNCDGSGQISCDNCDGKCKVDCSDCEGNGETELECGECEGSGSISEPCEDCAGSGKDNYCSGRIHGIINND